MPNSVPFTICDSLQVGELDWEALLYSVPPKNIVILYGSNEDSVAQMTISLVPEGIELWMLRGGLQEWCETGLPVDHLHDQKIGSEKAR
jgi:ABC-type xylose transport system substrate-binding protein